MVKHGTFEQTPTVFTVNEVAQMLRVHPTTLRRWCSTALEEGDDFFVLPHVGERVSFRFTEFQLNRLMSNVFVSFQA